MVTHEHKKAPEYPNAKGLTVQFDSTLRTFYLHRFDTWIQFQSSFVVVVTSFIRKLSPLQANQFENLWTSAKAINLMVHNVILHLKNQ